MTDKQSMSAYIDAAERSHTEHADKLTAELHVGAEAALDAATAQSYCSGDAPSSYLFDALRAAVAREVADWIKGAAESARLDERRELLGELGADPAWDSRPSREDVKVHVRWLEARARLEPG